MRWESWTEIRRRMGREGEELKLEEVEEAREED
jgi:hypothetical protein